ncbi:MAG: RluA family pseudouridine synthase [Chromatiales bacterium]|nr:MAG: RluA family pseudouridine synthase [Chromatiales bacterium]
MNGAVPRAVRVTASEDEAGRRLDNFLLTHLKGVPRAHVYRLIRSGEVRVNSGRVKASYRLIAGDEVRVPPVRQSDASNAPPPGRVRADWIEALVLYEDDELLVLNKPSGLAVHGGSGISLGAIELLRAIRGPHTQLELAHRLDRDTSGCLLIAKRRAALRALHAQFRDGTVDKRYLALLIGRWPGRARTVDAPLLTDERRGGERHVRVDATGKESITRFVPLERFPDAVLAEVLLTTGRTHQIRVHAASIGHPVAGDERYGLADDPMVSKQGLKRLFLHARSLAFLGPSNGKQISVEAPLGDDLTAPLDRLRAHIGAVLVPGPEAGSERPAGPTS